MKLLPDSTPAEVAFTIGYCMGRSNDAEIWLRALGQSIAAKAWLCGQSDDPAAFQELLEDVDGLLRKRTDAEVELVIAELINRNLAFDFIVNANPVAAQFGFSERSGQLGESLKSVSQWKALRDNRGPNPNGDLIDRHGGEWSMLMTPSLFRTVRNPLRITLQDLEPGRLMEHETVAWTGTYLVWTLLVLAMGLAAASRLRSRVLIRRLATRLEQLLIPRDWVVVLGAGVLVPIGFFLAVTRLTALGGRSLSMASNNWDAGFTDLPLGLTQHLALALLILVASGTTAGARFRRRTRFLALPKSGITSSLIAIACLTAFIPLSGWSVVHSSDAATVASRILAFFGIGWLIVVISKSFFGHYLTQLGYGVVSRMLVIPCTVAGLLVLSAAPVFKARAYRWSGMDQFIRTDKEHPSGTEFDHRLALQLRKELREALGYKP